MTIAELTKRVEALEAALAELRGKQEPIPNGQPVPLISSHKIVTVTSLVQSAPVAGPGNIPAAWATRPLSVPVTMPTIAMGPVAAPAGAS